MPEKDPKAIDEQQLEDTLEPIFSRISIRKAALEHMKDVIALLTPPR